MAHSVVRTAAARSPPELGEAGRPRAGSTASRLSQGPMSGASLHVAGGAAVTDAVKLLSIKRATRQQLHVPKWRNFHPARATNSRILSQPSEMAPISLSELPASTAAIIAAPWSMTRMRIDQASTFPRSRLCDGRCFLLGPMGRLCMCSIRLGAGEAQDGQRTSLRSDTSPGAAPLPHKICPLRTFWACLRIGRSCLLPDCVLTPRKIRDSLAGVLQLVHAGTCVYQ